MSGHPYQQRKDENKQPVYVTRIGDRHFQIDLTKLEGNGDFPCPGCEPGHENEIRPGDWTDENYRMIDEKKIGGELAELTLHCNKCGSRLVLTGFYVEEQKKA